MLTGFYNVNVSVSGTTRDFDCLLNAHGSFKIRDDNYGATTTVVVAYKFPSDRPLHILNTNTKLISRHISIGGRGCALEMDPKARTRKLRRLDLASVPRYKYTKKAC